ncbi:MAG: helix-turn-helix domain-containing protein [Pseudomonadota bacterium]
MKEMPGSVTRENCGTVFKEIRQRFGSMSVAELAKTLGVSRSTVMRIEAGQTLPSDELLNRLKAVQLIGISKFRELSEKDRTRFLQLVEETGEDPEMFSKVITNHMVKDLTPAGILAGLGTIASASLNLSTSVISSIPVLSSLAGYGLVKGLKAILDANNLNCIENEGVWEITKERGVSPDKEVEEMSGKKENEEKNGGVNFDFGLGGLFKGLGTLIDSATKLAEKGEELSKSGEIDFSSLEKIKGLKDLKGVYGVRVRTLADGRPSVQPFGNIKNIKKTSKGPVVEEVREPIVDLFDESDEIRVVAEMPGIDEKDITIEIKGDILNISAEGDNRKYQKEVLLSREAKADDMTWAYRNGMLEIKIMASGQ